METDTAMHRFGPEPQIDLHVDIGSLRLPTPVMSASGCLGPELSEVLDFDSIGAMVTKTVFAAHRPGNAAQRVADVYSGMLNSVGIPSPGTAGFVNDLLPLYRHWRSPLIISVGGLVDSEYRQVIEGLESNAPDAYELNLSCPNLNHGGMIASNPKAVAKVIRSVRSHTSRPLLAKLTPVTSSIGETAKAAEDAGADAVTVSNSFPGMAISLDDRRPVLGNVSGGYSGAAIKPQALKLVYDASQAVRIPVIGCGGILSGRDAAEFLVVGASAVQVGTATFSNPNAISEIQQQLESFVRDEHLTHVTDLIATLGKPRNDKTTKQSIEEKYEVQQ